MWEKADYQAAALDAVASSPQLRSAEPYWRDGAERLLGVLLADLDTIAVDDPRLKERLLDPQLQSNLARHPDPEGRAAANAPVREFTAFTHFAVKALDDAQRWPDGDGGQ